MRITSRNGIEDELTFQLPLARKEKNDLTQSYDKGPYTNIIVKT